MGVAFVRSADQTETQDYLHVDTRMHHLNQRPAHALAAR